MSYVLSRTESLSGLMGKVFPLFAAAQSKLSFFITLFFICLSGWFAGQTVWFFIQEQTSVPKWQAKPLGNNTVTQQDGLNISKLATSELFGRYSEQEKKVVVAPVLQDAPKTRLNLILVGAVSSSVAENSLAVIANKGSQATYGIGEQIEGTQATLKGVFIDRVIIENSGRDETLMLEGIEFKRVAQSNVSQPSNASARQVGNNPPASEIEIDAIRTEIIADPQKILQYIRLSQVKKDGELVGYRIRPGKQRALFDSAGLENGDIATSLNGADLTDPASMGQIWESMPEMTEFNLTVERNGQSHEIYIAF